jgi:phosphate/sulfate permease
MLLGATSGGFVATLVAGLPVSLLASLIGVAAGLAAARGLTALHDRWLLAEAKREATVTSDSA